MWELDHKESWAPKNCYFWITVLEKTLESPLDCKEIQTVHPKGDQSWLFIGRTDAEAETNTLAIWWKELTRWKRPWCWERLKMGEGEDRGRAGWTPSLTWWTRVWVSFRSWWGTGKPGVLQSMGLQRVWASNDNTAQKLVLNLPQEVSTQKLCPYWRQTASEKYHPPLLTQPLPLSWVSTACILHKCIPIQGWKNKVSVLHFIHAVSFHPPK